MRRADPEGLDRCAIYPDQPVKYPDKGLAIRPLCALISLYHAGTRAIHRQGMGLAQ
ncbi:MAG: hypothetical protein ACR2HF_07450 [Methylococcaceae bacterium]